MRFHDSEDKNGLKIYYNSYKTSTNCFVSLYQDAEMYRLTHTRGTHTQQLTLSVRDVIKQDR